jgi:hypothetical protein
VGECSPMQSGRLINNAAVARPVLQSSIIVPLAA